MLGRLNLNLILAAVAVVLVLYYAMGYDAPVAQPQVIMAPSNKGQIYDAGMYDFGSKNVFGTVSGPGRSDTMSVRPEFHKNPFPLAEGCTNCDKKGIEDAVGGHDGLETMELEEMESLWQKIKKSADKDRVL